MKPHAHKQANNTTELVSVRSAGKNFASHFGDRFKDYVGVCVCTYPSIHVYMHACNTYGEFILYLY